MNAMHVSQSHDQFISGSANRFDEFAAEKSLLKLFCIALADIRSTARPESS